MSAKQQLKILSLDDYFPSLYSWIFAEYSIKPQQTKQMYMYFISPLPI